MNVIQLFGLKEFGIEVAIAAAVVAVAEFALKKFGGKLPTFIANYLPLIIAFAAYSVVYLAVYGGIDCFDDLLYGGIFAYSIGTVAAIAAIKLLRGEKADDALFLLVQGVAENILRENSCSEITEIASFLRRISDYGAVSVKQNIVAILKKAAKHGVSDTEIDNIAEIILLSAQSLIKEK